MKKIIYLFIALGVIMACSPSQTRIQDLRAPAGLNNGLGFVEIDRDLPGDWNFDVWINPKIKERRPLGKPNFSLRAGGKKDYQLYYIQGRVQVYARAWKWLGDERIEVAKTPGPIIVNISPSLNRDGFGWEIAVTAADLWPRPENYQRVSHRWDIRW